MIRSGFFTNTEEARNKGSREKTKLALDTALFFVGHGQCLIRKLGGREDVGTNDPTRLAQPFLG